MTKLAERLAGIGFFILSVMLWLYVVLISSDNPVNISSRKFIVSLLGLILFGAVYSTYYRKIKRKTVGGLLTITLLFWFSDVVNVVRYNHHNYSSLLTILGFSITLFCIGQSIYRLK